MSSVRVRIFRVGQHTLKDGRTITLALLLIDPPSTRLPDAPLVGPDGAGTWRIGSIMHVNPPPRPGSLPVTLIPVGEPGTLAAGMELEFQT